MKDRSPGHVTPYMLGVTMASRSLEECLFSDSAGESDYNLPKQQVI